MALNEHHRELLRRAAHPRGTCVLVEDEAPIRLTETLSKEGYVMVAKTRDIWYLTASGKGASYIHEYDEENNEEF